MPETRATSEVIQKMIKYKQSGQTNREIGELLGFSTGYVRTLLIENMDEYEYGLLRNKYNLACLKKFAQDDGGDCLSTDYTNESRKYEWLCKCGCQFKGTWSGVRKGATKCPQCELEKKMSREIEMEERREELKKVLENKETFYENSASKVANYIIETLDIRNSRVINIIHVVSKKIYNKIYYRSFKLENIAGAIVNFITPINKNGCLDYFKSSLNRIRAIQNLFSEKEKNSLNKIKEKMIDIYDWSQYNFIFTLA